LNSEEANLFTFSRYFVRQQDEHSTTLLALMTKDNQPVVTLFRTGDHKLAYQFAGSAQLVVVGDVKTEEWHSLQVHLAINGSASQIEIWHDGVLLRRDPVQLGDVKIGTVELGETRTGRTYEIFFDQFAIDRQCIGACPTDLVTPTPTIESSTETPVPAEPTIEPTVAPTEVPTETSTNTPEPTATTAPPTGTPAPTETAEPAPTDTPESDESGG
jgi:hypothetical protein